MGFGAKNNLYKTKSCFLPKCPFILAFSQRCKMSVSNCSPNSQANLAKPAVWCFLISFFVKKLV